jgi:cell division transport system ATP-binding protein
MIQFFHIHKRYGVGPPVLSDASLKIEKGEFVFLVGESGAGKSTLLKLILCEEQADRGQILFDGRNISRLKEGDIPALRRKVGFIFQDFRLIARQTVYENVGLPMRIAGASAREIRKRVLDVLSLVHLERQYKQLPSALSGGERQRVAIARALVHRPVLVLADEPTSSLDDTLADEMMTLFKNVHAMGTTLIVATHQRTRIPKTASPSSPRTLILRRGEIIENDETPLLFS